MRRLYDYALTVVSGEDSIILPTGKALTAGETGRLLTVGEAVALASWSASHLTRTSHYYRDLALSASALLQAEVEDITGPAVLAAIILADAQGRSDLTGVSLRTSVEAAMQGDGWRPVDRCHPMALEGLLTSYALCMTAVRDPESQLSLARSSAREVVLRYLDRPRP